MTDYTPSPQVREWCKANGWDAEHYAEVFNDYLANRTRKPYKNFDAAFRNCVRSDWGRIRSQRNYVPPRQKPADYLSSDGKSRWVPATKDSEGYWEKRNEL